jgi:AcrR family transcriptional regulator
VVQVKRQRAAKQPAEVRREAVIDAAVRVFARTPYRSAGTAEIAREAGIAEPTIYRHFGSKRELYLAALERTCAGIVTEWHRIVERTPDTREALDAIGGWYYQNVIANPDLLRLRLRATAEAEDDEVREQLRRGYGEIEQILTDLIRRGQERGEISPAIDAHGAAWLFIGMGQVLDLAVMTGLDPETEPWCHAIGDAFRRALEPGQA